MRAFRADAADTLKRRECEQSFYRARKEGRDAYEFDFEFIGRPSSDKADSIRCSINLESDSNSKTSRRSFVRSYMRACDNTRCEATRLRIRATNAIDRSIEIERLRIQMSAYANTVCGNRFIIRYSRPAPR